MSITITGRQFPITEAIRVYVEEHLSGISQDGALKVSSINVVMDKEKNHFTTSLVVNCKYHTITSEVKDYELYRSFDAALDKIERQLGDLKEKIREHKATPLCDIECAKAAEAQE